MFYFNSRLQFLTQVANDLAHMRKPLQNNETYTETKAVYTEAAKPQERTC